MKYITFLLLCITSSLWAQNLVPNSGFEEYKYLPNSMLDSGHEFEKVSKFWRAANLASTDLISPRFSTNKFKAIPAHSGRNMAGIVIHGDFWSEYVSIKLREKLVPDATYYLEFWMAYNKDYHKRKELPVLNTNFGAFIGKKRFQKDTKIIELHPQVSSKVPKKIIPNKWIKISGSFTADSEDNYLYIGQFLNDSNADLATGYFYIDDVLVERFIDVSKVYNPKNTTPDGLNNIYFETDKYELLPQSFEVLNQVSKYLEKNPSIKIEIIGHTDSEGEGYHNQELSDNRANSVKTYLIENGIKKERLTSKGEGSGKPIAKNTTEAGRQQNRRVEFLASSKLVSKRDIREVDQNEIDINYTFSRNFNKPDHLLNIGRYDKVMACQSIEYTTSESSLKNYEAEDAKSIILKKVADHKAVCINDSRLHPQTRIFTKSMLQDFYDKGFRHFAVGDLFASSTKINERGYPATTDGKYIKEPEFAEMIRTALKIGFEILPYAPTSDEIAKAKRILAKDKQFANDNKALSISANQWSRAMNIIRTINRNNGIKMLIYSGQNGARKLPKGNSKYLSYWLKKLGNLDLITIDQATMIENCHKSVSSLSKSINRSTPAVFTNNGKVFVESVDQNNLYDIQVFHPKTAFKASGRTNWSVQNKTEKSINIDKYGFTYPCLVIAYNADEDFEAGVPFDIIEIESNKNQPKLLLNSGNYKILLKDTHKRKMINVKIN